MATTVKMEGENQGEFIDMNRDFSYDQYNRPTKSPTPEATANPTYSVEPPIDLAVLNFNQVKYCLKF